MTTHTEVQVAEELIKQEATHTEVVLQETVETENTSEMSSVKTSVKTVILQVVVLEVDEQIVTRQTQGSEDQVVGVMEAIQRAVQLIAEDQTQEEAEAVGTVHHNQEPTAVQE